MFSTRGKLLHFVMVGCFSFLIFFSGLFFLYVCRGWMERVRRDKVQFRIFWRETDRDFKQASHGTIQEYGSQIVVIFENRKYRFSPVSVKKKVFTRNLNYMMQTKTLHKIIIPNVKEWYSFKDRVRNKLKYKFHLQTGNIWYCQHASGGLLRIVYYVWYVDDSNIKRNINLCL